MWRAITYRLRSITSNNTAREKYLQIAQLDNCTVDAVGTLQRFSSTFSALSWPSYLPGPFKAALNALGAEKRALKDLGA